jgi:hypothetical protein
MLRKVLVYLVLALLSIESLGCTGRRTVVRGQSPDRLVDLAPLRRRIRRDVEPVLDATWKVHRRIEPALEVTEDATEKGLALTGYLAALVGLWWLDQTPYDVAPSTGAGSSSRSASGGGTKERTKEATDEPRRHDQGD